MTLCPLMPAFLSCLSHDLGGWGIAALGNLVDYHSFLPRTKGFFLGGWIRVIVSAVVFNQVCVLSKTYRMSKEV